MNKCALYARVSTKNNGQNPETQLLPLREYAKARGLTIVEEFVDNGVSGAKDRRPALDALMTAAGKGAFDVVLVWKFDRFARSTRHLVLSLEFFHSVGIHFISQTEAIDTSTPMGQMIFTVLGAVAELERSLIKERVHSGLARARKEGKTLGRPRVIVDHDKVLGLRADGQTVRAIASRLGITKSTVQNIVKAAAQEGEYA
jgi:DNA invertase Pin-like site-specific DNA recombinase